MITKDFVRDVGPKHKFRGIVYFLAAPGFVKRTKGEHHIFSKKGVDEIINLQPAGSEAKPYQVKQCCSRILMK